jgi:hypothetical protein
MLFLPLAVSMMCHHGLCLFVIGEFRACGTNFGDDEIGSGAVFDDVLIQLPIARDDHRVPMEIDAVAIGGGRTGAEVFSRTKPRLALYLHIIMPTPSKT